MDTERLKVLVFGATGKQGGHVARQLLKRGHSVYAFTRRPNSHPACDLQDLGANIVTGDFNNRPALERAFADVDAVFAMSTPFEGGMKAEVRQGNLLVDVAKAKGKYLVFTSVCCADRNTGIPHFDTKWKIEQHIHKVRH